MAKIIGEIPRSKGANTKNQKLHFFVMKKEKEDTFVQIQSIYIHLFA